jgi:hypothetical protein
MKKYDIFRDDKMLKKQQFTLKNGAFTPRIQSILALFLGDILWKYFM